MLVKETSKWHRMIARAAKERQGNRQTDREREKRERVRKTEKRERERERERDMEGVEVGEHKKEKYYVLDRAPLHTSLACSSLDQYSPRPRGPPAILPKFDPDPKCILCLCVNTASETSPLLKV